MGESQDERESHLGKEEGDQSESMQRKGRFYNKEVGFHGGEGEQAKTSFGQVRASMSG